MKKPILSLRVAAFSWLFLVVTLSVLAFRQGPVFDSSIMNLLPTSTQQPLVQNATDKMAARFSKRLIVLMSGDDEAAVRQGIRSLANTLSSMPDVAEITWKVENSELSRFRQELFPYRFAVLDASQKELLQADAFTQIKDNAIARLFSPLPSGENNIIADPFGLFNSLALNRSNNLKLQVSDSLLKATRTIQPTYMLMMTLAGDAFSPALQRRLLGTLESEQKRLAPSGIHLTMSGMILHAAAGAKQASREISTIGLGSLLGIIAIMLWVFRQFKPLLLMLFPVAIGCVTAAAVTQLIFGKIHLITFAFGAGLVGVSIDYALHFLCERRNTKASTILPKILPGLLLGLFSSVLAYAAQAFAPFPGLQQMATFSVIGLIASWLTVVLCLPLLTRNDVLQPLPMAVTLDKLRRRFPRIEKNPALISGLLIALVLSVITLLDSQHQNPDDIRLLQTSPPALIEQEKSVQKALGVSSSAQFLLITAPTLEQCLQTEEHLSSQLDNLKASGLLGHYQALSKELPSLTRQTENIHAVQQLYQTQLAAFFNTLKLADSQRIDAISSFEQESARFLTPALWKQLHSSASGQDFIVQSQGPAATVIRFSGTFKPEVKQRLINLADSFSGAESGSEADVYYVDQVENISTLLGHYRSQVMNWVLIAYLGVLLVLLLRYKQQVWRIVLPPLLASIFTLAILMHFEQGINLFHLMALILVLGIGLDMGIFLSETHDAAHTWLAVSLSTLTSLLAFGLLALSKTPVLHHFGTTVLIGLTCVWLLAPMMRKQNSGDVQI
ncbi:MMPL family transporter [Neptunomonas antarctica]|uniref:Predicted exporter n=1 Tax=Neptunomonas antarctica TaxID=619304 RepID=A0A1N7IT01_9GAMM|nr:MMPL family transporter [Neptunomonas antarctica]SIS40228.1 Predicted exporter [Neptunomonas antarctica]